MIAADRPVQRPPEARLLVVDASGQLSHRPRSSFVDLLRSGDLVVANDAATLPASLHGTHQRSGATTCTSSAPWSSARATTASAPRTARHRRRCSRATC